MGRILTLTKMLRNFDHTRLRRIRGGAHGAKAHRYVLPPTKGVGNKEPLVKFTEAVAGILREDLEIKGESLFIEAAARKGGKRTAPLELWLQLPYVNLIVEQWKRTPQSARVWPLTEWDSWNLMKQIDAKKYPHFLRFNRITELCANPKLSVADICSWTGLSPQTINSYMERSGRFIRRTARVMREQYQESVA